MYIRVLMNYGHIYLLIKANYNHVSSIQWFYSATCRSLTLNNIKRTSSSIQVNQRPILQHDWSEFTSVGTKVNVDTDSTRNTCIPTLKFSFRV